MESRIKNFFAKMPETIDLYRTFEKKVLLRHPQVDVKIQKSQIKFSNRHGFAYVWLPVFKMKNRPDVYIIVSFVLPCRLESPRIEEATELPRQRWIHHVIVDDPVNVNEQLLLWIDQSYDFAMTSGSKP